MSGLDDEGRGSDSRVCLDAGFLLRLLLGLGCSLTGLAVAACHSCLHFLVLIQRTETVVPDHTLLGLQSPDNLVFHLAFFIIFRKQHLILVLVVDSFLQTDFHLHRLSVRRYAVNRHLYLEILILPLQGNDSLIHNTGADLADLLAFGRLAERLGGCVAARGSSLPHESQSEGSRVVESSLLHSGNLRRIFVIDPVLIIHLCGTFLIPFQSIEIGGHIHGETVNFGNEGIGHIAQIRGCAGVQTQECPCYCKQSPDHCSSHCRVLALVHISYVVGYKVSIAYEFLTCIGQLIKCSVLEGFLNSGL